MSVVVGMLAQQWCTSMHGTKTKNPLGGLIAIKNFAMRSPPQFLTL